MVDITIKGGDAIGIRLRELTTKVDREAVMEMGFMENSRYPDTGQYVAEVAAMNEFGTDTSPPRPFFRGTINVNSQAWGESFGKALVRSNYDVAMSLGAVGLRAQDDLKTAIRDFTTPGNAPSTIARKGFDDPLIDSRQMLISPTSRVKTGETT